MEKDTGEMELPARRDELKINIEGGEMRCEAVI